MRKHLLSMLFIALIFSGTAQAQEESAREVFKRTRKPATEEPTPPKKEEPTVAGNKTNQAQTSASNPAPIRIKKRVRVNSNGASSAAKNKAPGKDLEQMADDVADTNIGLGYTLFLDNGSGELSSVSADRVFHTGQAVRLLLESNIDGYLYIFHQENDGPPKMLFPNWQDNEGDNYIRSHKLVFVPSENKFSFVGNPAIETLTVVTSRRPISGLPIGQDLQGAGRVNIPPILLQQLIQPCSCVEEKDDTKRLQTEYTKGARDVELTKSDPLPAYVRLNRDQNAARLVTRIKLIHR